MTRKKSKMLALAVMGAILMGGYSGVNPVYATDQNFDGNITATGTITAANNKFLVKNDGTLQVEDALTISHAGDNTADDPGKSATLNIDRLSKLNQLVEYSSGDKTAITAGDNSMIGGVGFNAGALTGVTSINANDDGAKFRVTQDDKNYTFRAGNFMVTTGKENGYLNGSVTLYDTNRSNQHISIDEMVTTRNRTKGISRESTGAYTEIEGKLTVYKDGKVNVDGPLTARSGSKIGDITISDGRLSVPMGPDTVGVNVSDLAADHDLVNDTEVYGNKKLKESINTVERAANAVSMQTEGIHRIAKAFDGTDKNGTSIENTLEVYENGTVVINENEAQQVTIDSNGIKVGQGSAYINNDGFKAGADGKNSLTTVGLKAKEIRAGNNNTEFFVDGGGNVVADGTLSAAGGNFDVSSEGNITARGSLSVAGDKFRVNADGSINANNKFNIDADGALRAANDKFTADKDGNVRAIGSLSAANTKFFVGTDGSINVNQKFIVDADGTISSEGTLSVAGGKFKVDADGVVTAGSVKMDNIEAANGAGVTVGGVVLKDKTITAADGKFTVDEYGNIVSAGTLSIGNVSLIANDHVGADGKWVYNDQNIGDDAKFKVSDGKIAYKVGNYSVTTSSATATRDNDVDQANKGTVFSNDTNYTRIDGAEVNSVNGANIGKLDGASLELKSEHGNIKLIHDQGTFTDANGNYTEISGARITTSIITAKEGVNAKTISIGANAGDFWQQEFYVDENGNVYTKGTLSAAGGNFSVDADGTVITKKLITDELVITGSGTAGGSTGGSIAFGGSGTIKSNIKEGSREMTFETTVDGVNTKVTDGTKTTTVTTAASGTTFTNETETDTKINGSSVISSKSSTDTGTLDGSNLTLVNGEDQTKLSAGGASFTKDGKTTTIDGGNISTDGMLSVAGGKFTVGADGSFSAASGNFKIDGTGTMTAGTVKMDKIEATDATKGIDVGGVNLKDKSITAADGKFKVDADGKVIINEGTKNQVRIDSNGIKVGNNSAFISDDGFKSSGDLYIGTKTAPTEAATDARFYVKGSDGSVKAADGKFTVEADGGFTAADGKFKVDGDGNLEVKDAAGNSKSINLSEMADMSQDVARMNNRISDVSDRVNKVGAMSAAIASLKTIGYDPEAPTEFSVGLGQYKSETGLALGIFHYPNRNVMFNLSLSTSGGETMGGIGATWRIGHGASQKQMEVTVQDDVEKVIVKKEDYEALQAQVNQLAQVVQQLVAEKEARNS